MCASHRLVDPARFTAAFERGAVAWRPTEVSLRLSFWTLPWLLLVCLALLPATTWSQAEAGSESQALSSALAVPSGGERFPSSAAARAVTLPDDWSTSWPGHEGSVWYRSSFARPAEAATNDLLALYIERACSSVDVHLNGRRIFSSGRLTEPVTRNCHLPQLVPLPAALLRSYDNVLDLQVSGHALERVASGDRAGHLSALRIGPQSLLAAEHARRVWWSVTLVQIIGTLLAALGVLMMALGWINRREPYLAYFGAACVGWALLSTRFWLRELPWPNGVTEMLYASGFAVVASLAVQFLLSHAGLRPPRVAAALLLQCVLLPALLVAAGPARLYALAHAAYAVLALELAAAFTVHLVAVKRSGRHDARPLAWLLAAAAVVLALELAAQSDRYGLPPIPLLQFSVPLLFIGIGARLLDVFARALHAAEAGKNSLDGRIRDITAEIERNFAQIAELRVEQVTEKERKRIAGDLHDDLGAKLLTIVHTSESERISTLAREALEEMRLSVRGLTGKPMRLADALADWRAETVLRLGQANIEADWRSPAEEIEHLLPARGFVQTTRILREAVSNIIKHSGASHCKVRCAISDRQFGLTVQDNGKGIPMELDGKLDRGHGMSSMKHRAKQMQGQCLVESGPGYGTVIRLTLPL